MGFALLMTCIHCALDDVELMVKRCQPIYNQRFKILRFKLRNLKTFILSARTLDSDGNLKSLLVRIEDMLQRNVERVHPLCLHSNAPTLLQERAASDFEDDIEFFKDDIDACYVAIFTNYTQHWNTCSCNTDHHILNILASFLQNLVDFRRLIRWPRHIQALLDTMEEFEQQMSFVKSLIHFASIRSVESIHYFSADSGALTIYAALFIFRFRYINTYPQDSKELQHVISVLLQSIKPIGSLVYDAYIGVLTSSKLQSGSLDVVDDGDAMKDFLDSLISSLWDLLRLNNFSVSMKDLQEVYEGLRSLRTIFKQQQQSKIKGDVGNMLCDAGILICSIHHEHGEVDLVLKNFLVTMRRFLDQIGGSKENLFSKEIREANILASNDKQGEAEVKQVTETHRTHLSVPPLGEGCTSATNEQVVVGLHDEQRLIVEQLTRGSRELKIVAIVGMPGLGKTTLATAVYTNPSVFHYFHVRAWSPVSQVVDKRRVMQDLFNQIDPSKCSEQDLANGLRQSLTKRRYLIFLDDVWDTEAWYSLKESFPDDNVGSRIILTSRRHDVAPHDLMVGQKPHHLRQLNEDESMELLQRNFSFRLSLDHGMEVVEKCRGLPLLILIVSGLLKATEPKGWNGILYGLKNVSSTDTQCKNTLELSYQHLPANLRPCLLYFGAFPEDKEVSVRRLLRLWSAEGFVQNDGVAEGYLEELIGRSLIMVAKQRSSGGVKTCRVHDLLHDFCMQKAKDEHFFHILKGFDELSAFNELHSGLRRLCIHSEVEHFKQSKLFCPRARSLIFNSSERQSIEEHWHEEMQWVDISSALRIFKLLTVLDIEEVDLGDRFPTEIEHLVQLAFLAIQCDTNEIPPLVGTLSLLQTFIMQYSGTCPVSLPATLWNLQKLQLLYIRSHVYAGICQGGGSFPKSNPDDSSALPQLERLSGAVIPHSEMESLVRKLPDIRALKCTLLYREDDSKIVALADTLSRVESLHMLCDNYFSDKLFTFDHFTLPTHLKKLTLDNFNLSQRNLSTIGELPDLTVLKLLRVGIEGDAWEMKEREFPRLKIVKLVSLKLVRWFTDCEDQLDCFQKLVLKDCWKLEEMPSSMDSIPTLQVIEVSDCPDYVVHVVKQIEERRKDLMGDSGLKIIASRIWAIGARS